MYVKEIFIYGHVRSCLGIQMEVFVRDTHTQRELV